MAEAPNPFPKRYLMTAGPTPLPPRVSQVMAEPILYHRAPAFIEVFARCLERLPQVFRTSNPVLCFAGSGTAAMESAVANLIAPGDLAAVASCGKFGERWSELCDAYGANTARIVFEWGARVEPERLDAELSALGAKPRALFVTQSETSTGVVNDIRALAEVAQAHETVLCVDAISGLGAVELRQDEWGVDVVVAGSQKSLMCPPGLAFASVSERALALAADEDHSRPPRRYYLDWRRTANEQAASPPSSAFTPAVSLLMGLDIALELILTEGLDRVFARHALLARAARAGIEAIGLERFGPDDPNANVITAAELPAGVDGAAVPKRMRDAYGVTVAGGQGQLRGRIVRIAHCGYYGGFDILIALSALEMALRDLGGEVEPGAGAGAAEAVFAEAGSVPEPVAG